DTAADDLTAAVEGQPTGAPGADPGDAGQVTVGLVLYHVLDRTLAPQMKALFFAPPNLTVEVDGLEYNNIDCVLGRHIHNGVGDQSRQLVVQVVDLIPGTTAASASVFLLLAA